MAVAPSTNEAPVPWGSGAAAAAVELIGEIDLGAVSTFSAIPQTFDLLKLSARLRLTVPASGADFSYIRINGDTSAAYDSSHAYLNNSVYGQAQTANQTEALVAIAPAGQAVTNAFGVVELIIPGYSMGGLKSWVAQYQCLYARSAIGQYVGSTSGTWHNTNAITQLALVPQGGGVFAAGSRAWLYGLRG
jgi:hypothetical protein